MFAFKPRGITPRSISIAIGAIVLTLLAPDFSAPPNVTRGSVTRLGATAQAMTPYGTGDGLTLRQSRILQRGEIAFPQSYRAMVSKFGYPDYRDERADYYRMNDGRLASIVYSGASAVAVEGL
ncbi:hypothetical protein IQ266_17920 [filamentous cyanobacterium LEGE 11480]|uniref:Uncharacterized protein n=1 Tax=Romeriopsis navalis LEGE 11480 TaxID=2777977 RepID=A0A928VT54_9CYAN|nr:hypothetical protein [Romeriopsis navalis]MBE9031614.1 hypothetical protein [Romeriopsis navalis LEGE 11480]